jgi:uncharacterized protein YdiU (UPF0061 family)
MHEVETPLQAPAPAPVIASDPARLRWTNRFHALGADHHTELVPQPLPQPHWVATSPACAEWLGLPPDWATNPTWDSLAVLAGNRLWPGMQPLASVYSGYQFGVWAGQLGDGRALMLGELEKPNGPVELQLKGAGMTPYSRSADGRAVLRSSIREFLCSEAMQALGIPTTRALAIVGSPLKVRRETLETAAVVTRAAPSFLRFGHFEHFTHTADNLAALQRLTDLAIAHHYPELQHTPQPVVALLAAVTQRTAALMAQWQTVGFCHGVMNTDNMSLLGLTLDYGPFGFLDAFDPNHICNHTDQQGRYAWARQPGVALWNLHALAQALMPLIEDSDAALAALEPYKAQFPQLLLDAWRAKLGLRFDAANETAAEREADRILADGLLRLMAQDRADFTITFRRLATFSTEPGAANDALRDLFIDRPAFDAWALRYAERLRSEHSQGAERALRMNRINPKFVLRNHLAETAIVHARDGDFSEVQRLLKVLQRPFDEQPESEADAGFPPDWATHLAVSCSS